MKEIFELQRAMIVRSGYIHSIADIRYPFLSFGGVVYCIFSRKGAMGFGFEKILNENYV